MNEEQNKNRTRRSAGVRFGIFLRVDMYHNMFDLRKAILNGVVYCFGYAVRFGKIERFVNAYFNIDIYLVAEISGAQKVYADNAVNIFNAAAHFSFGFSVTGAVNHAVDSVLENIVGDLENKQADNNACNRFKNREAQSRASYA